MMRSIGMDVHRSFAQVAICDDGQITDSFKVDMEHDAVVEFGRVCEQMTRWFWRPRETPQRSSGF